MSLREQIKQINEVMQRTKDDWVAEAPKNPDLQIYLHFWRGEDMVITVQCPGDRDKALEAAYVGAMGFSADVMSITFESYHSLLKVSPVTGKDWMPQEMQYVSETYPDAADKGWVTPCLTTTIHDRAGGYGLYSLPYSLKENRVIWGEPVILMEGSDGEDGGQGAGYMYDRLQDAMQRPKAADMFTEQLGQGNPMVKLLAALLDDDEATLFHSDVATMRVLKEKGLVHAVVLRAETGSKREELIQDRFGDIDEEEG